MAELRLATKTGEFTPTAIALIEQAITTSKPCAELERDAGWIYAWAEREHNFPPGDAIRHLQTSVQLGFEKQLLAQDPALACYLKDMKRDLSNSSATDAMKANVIRAKHVSDHNDLLLEVNVEMLERSGATKPRSF